MLCLICYKGIDSKLYDKSYDVHVCMCMTCWKVLRIRV